MEGKPGGLGLDVGGCVRQRERPVGSLEAHGWRGRMAAKRLSCGCRPQANLRRVAAARHRVWCLEGLIIELVDWVPVEFELWVETGRSGSWNSSLLDLTI